MYAEKNQTRTRSNSEIQLGSYTVRNYTAFFRLQFFYTRQPLQLQWNLQIAVTERMQKKFESHARKTKLLTVIDRWSPTQASLYPFLKVCYALWQISATDWEPKISSRAERKQDRLKNAQRWSISIEKDEKPPSYIELK